MSPMLLHRCLLKSPKLENNQFSLINPDSDSGSRPAHKDDQSTDSCPQYALHTADKFGIRVLPPLPIPAYVDLLIGSETEITDSASNFGPPPAGPDTLAGSETVGHSRLRTTKLSSSRLRNRTDFVHIVKTCVAIFPVQHAVLRRQ